MQVMVERDAQYTLFGDVQVDDAYLGGELAGGKAGRGSENKVPFGAVISLSAEGRPLSIKMAPVPIGIFIVAVSLNVFLANTQKRV